MSSVACFFSAESKSVAVPFHGSVRLSANARVAVASGVLSAASLASLRFAV